MQILEISTPRLLLRALTPEVHKYLFTECDDNTIMRFLGLETKEALQTERERYEGGLVTYNKSYFYFLLVDKKTNMVMGWCGFHTWYLQHHRAELGYLLYKDEFKQKGFLSEALPEIIKYGFTKLNLHRIEAMIGPANEASLRLIRKAGFKEEGLMKEHYLRNGIYEDSLIFALLC